VKIFRFITGAVSALALTFLLTKAWLESLVSERLWTFINNQLSSGANPGLTSDIELVVVVSISLLTSTLLIYLALKIWSLRHQRR
jgi:hypothetical protein